MIMNFIFQIKTITVKQFIDMQKLANFGTEQINMMMDFYDSKGGFSEFKEELRKIMDRK